MRAHGRYVQADYVARLAREAAARIETTPRTTLVIIFGFSRSNAEKALGMVHDGTLTNVEEEVIKLVQRDPNRIDYYNNQYETMNRLNLRISEGIC